MKPLNKNNMKSKLAVFDFDYTIKQPTPGYCLGVSHLFPEKKVPEELEKNRDQGWDKFSRAVLSHVNDLEGITAEMLRDGMSNYNGNLVDGIDEVIRYLSTDHDIIIVSDSFTVNIEVYMKKCGLLDLIEGMFCKPTKITDEGKIQFDEIPIEWGGSCPRSGRLLCKGKILRNFIKDRKYDEIKFFGDGSNDLCPSLILEAKDRVFPRIGYPLVTLLTNGEHEVSAKIFPWNDGHDILDELKGK